MDDSVFTCKSCGCPYFAPDFDGDADEFVCGACANDENEAKREDMMVSRRKYGNG